MGGCFCRYEITARVLEDQAHLIARRRDILRQMRMTLDQDELWALGRIQHALQDAIWEAFPIDHWWFYKQEQLRCQD